MRAIALIGYVVFFFGAWFAFVALMSYVQAAYDDTLLPRVPIAAAAPAPRPVFDATGVLTFYRQTDGAKPWLIYLDGGTVRTKSLSCATCSAALERAYGGRDVRVIGAPVAEHVDVRTVALATTTEDRIQFLSAKLDSAGNASGVSITPRILGGESDNALVWADVEHDGTVEAVFFKQGTLVPVGSRTVTLLYAKDGAYRFAVIAP